MCVKIWVLRTSRTTPNGAAPCASAHCTASSTVSTPAQFGNSHSPASRPVSGRRRMAQVSPQRSRNTVRASTRFSAFGSFTGKCSARPAACAAQTPRIGQRAQSGFFGVQTQAPSSISACVNIPQFPAG